MAEVSPKTKSRKKTTPVKATRKDGRNADGTFAKGNKPVITKNTGRPPEVLSFRQQLKIRAAKDPALLDEALNTLIEIAKDPDHPKSTDAIDKLIKLNGNYDPAETKDVTPLTPTRPLEGLSLTELRQAMKLKKGKK